MRWFRAVFAMELRKDFAYRADFWLQFLGPMADMGLAYFLWKSIFDYRQVDRVGGFTFHSLMLYYVAVPLMTRVVRGDREHGGSIWTDIFEGHLSRYLVYPVSFVLFRFAGRLADFVMRAIHLLLFLVIFRSAFGLPEDMVITPATIAMALGIAFFACVSSFALQAAIEMAAFWADSIWSLLVMLRFAVNLLGGGLIPLAMFPEWAQTLLAFTPFPYFLSLPTRTLLGQATVAEWATGLVVLTGWFVVFYLAGGVVWRRGTRHYSGVGI